MTAIMYRIYRIYDIVHIVNIQDGKRRWACSMGFVTRVMSCMTNAREVGHSAAEQQLGARKAAKLCLCASDTRCSRIGDLLVKIPSGRGNEVVPMLSAYLDEFDSRRYSNVSIPLGRGFVVAARFGGGSMDHAATEQHPYNLECPIHSLWIGAKSHKVRNRGLRV